MAEARKIPYLPEIAILTGSAFMISSIFSMYSLTMPGMELLGSTYIALAWITVAVSLLAGIGWLVLGLVWHLREES